MGIKPRAGGECGGYVVNVQLRGPTTALGWVGPQKLKYRPFPIKIHVFFIGNGRFCLYMSVFACVCLYLLELLAAGVVGGLNYHLHVVRVAFLQTSRGDAHKLAVSLKLSDSAGTQVEHGLVQTTDQLVNHGG